MKSLRCFTIHGTAVDCDQNIKLDEISVLADLGIGDGHPEHHESPHVHATNKKGEKIVFTYPAGRSGR